VSDAQHEAATVRRGSVTVAGVRSPVLEAGPADAREAVVFVHGNPGSGEDWEPFLADIGRFARVVAPDMPGFGQADKPADFPYTVEGYAAHLAGVLDELGIDRAHLVVHDFGGPWGLAWAALHPTALASAVLVDTGVLPGYRWHYLARIWRTPGLGEVVNRLTTLAALRLLLRHGNRGGLPEAFVRRMYRDFDPATRAAVLKLYRSLDDPDGASRVLIAALQPLDRPALVIWGARDPYIGADMALRQSEAFPRAVVHVLPGSGHWPFADDPESFRALLVPFLERATAGAA
jgi:pimeloyl-ACP methyl ester carboxylesterase